MLSFCRWLESSFVSFNGRLVAMFDLASKRDASIKSRTDINVVSEAKQEPCGCVFPLLTEWARMHSSPSLGEEIFLDDLEEFGMHVAPIDPSICHIISCFTLWSTEQTLEFPKVGLSCLRLSLGRCDYAITRLLKNTFDFRYTLTAHFCVINFCPPFIVCTALPTHIGDWTQSADITVRLFQVPNYYRVIVSCVVTCCVYNYLFPHKKAFMKLMLVEILSCGYLSSSYIWIVFFSSVRNKGWKM